MLNYVEVQFENGSIELDEETAKQVTPENNCSRYLCDTCGCILNTNERPWFNPTDGNLMCEECYTI